MDFAMSSLVLWTGGGYWISFFYGQNWIPPMGAFYTLIGAGLFRGLAHGSGSMVQAMNRQDVDSIAKTAETVIFVLLILSMVPRFGMIGAGFAGLIYLSAGIVGKNQSPQNCELSCALQIGWTPKRSIEAMLALYTTLGLDIAYPEIRRSA